MHCHVRVLLHLARTLTIWPLRASPSREESSGWTRSESHRCQLYTTFPAPCSSSRSAATSPQFHSAVCCPSLSPYLQHTHVFPILPNILPNRLPNNSLTYSLTCTCTFTYTYSNSAATVICYSVAMYDRKHFTEWLYLYIWPSYI